MLLIKNDNEYKRIYIWKDEMPFQCVGQNTLHLRTEASDTNWHIGTICIEAQLHACCVSNYAMICMKYMDDQKDKTDIIINFGSEMTSFKSQVLPYNKTVCVGLNKEFADAIEEIFKENYLGKLPGGTIEILGGGYDEVGSSYVAFQKVMELLIFIFQRIDDLSDNDLQFELLNLM